MNKMIDDSLIGKIKKLFKSIWTDEKGNVEVGKDLEVDGNAKVNGYIDIGAVENDTPDLSITSNSIVAPKNVLNITAKNSITLSTNTSEGLIDISAKLIQINGELIDFNTYSTAKYHHVITLTITNLSSDYKLFIDAYLSTNTPVDSPQDLVTYLGGGLYPVTGYFQLRAGANLIPLSLNTHAETYADYVFTFEGREDDHHAPQSMTLAELLREIDALTITDDVSIPK